MENRRCSWCEKDDLYRAYHDEEWGVPVHDERKMFEFLTLESFQAGLSWHTILKKRENFRVAFDDFDYNKIAQYDAQKVNNLMEDKGIIRNKLKIEATINNANRFLEVQKENGSFCDFIWSYVDYSPIENQYKELSELPAKTELSDTISKDLKKLGFKFLGSTTVYAHMQATGMVNDHVLGCFRYNELLKNK